MAQNRGRYVVRKIGARRRHRAARGAPLPKLERIVIENVRAYDVQRLHSREAGAEPDSKTLIQLNRCDSPRHREGRGSSPVPGLIPSLRTASPGSSSAAATIRWSAPGIDEEVLTQFLAWARSSAANDRWAAII